MLSAESLGCDEPQQNRNDPVCPKGFNALDFNQPLRLLSFTVSYG